MISEEQFKTALSRLASGVTVVTTTNGEGQPVGLTVTAFSSLSLRPPLILICVDKGSNTYPSFLLKSHFVVNLLAEGQETLSSLFASRSVQNRFDHVSYTLNTHNIPLLEGCLGYLECQVEQALDGGDHTIFIGKVLAATVHQGNPLVYYAGNYRRLVTRRRQRPQLGGRRTSTFSKKKQKRKHTKP
jgi:flavin reductase (DIM6/NTAB) family NADH-FMN oxidoreductase RutF